MSFIEVSSDYFENIKNRDLVNNILKNISQWDYSINSMAKALITGTDTIKSQLDVYKDSYTILINQLNEAIFNVEQHAQQFALCILFNDNRKVYISRRINPKKDLCDYYQVTGGSLNENESYEDCARREAKEEAGVEVESISNIGLDKYIDETTNKLFECAIYIGYIGKQIPENKEPQNHTDWELVDFKTFEKRKLTPSLVTYQEKIKNAIINHRLYSRSNKKRKVEDVGDLKIEEYVNLENIKTEDDIKLENEINNTVEYLTT